jgi:alkylation response protein AidB-like acyl-CoA dehydrogenase
LNYVAPVDDMLFCMTELAGLDELSHLSCWADSGVDTARAILAEAARFCGEVVEPLNAPSDRIPPAWSNGNVAASAGFRAAFRAFADGGWQGLLHPTEFGGQGLPKTLGAACAEMLNSASVSFALCPLLTDGAIEALLTAGSPEQQARYLPPLVVGRWTGTMNLTEAQAGSDLSALRTVALPQADGSWRITGQKIYITWGEHDLAENIVHLVLARTPDAPPGIRGLSLFVCPKFLVSADGSLGERNDVYCASIEHKLGIRGSPTAVLIFGDGLGAVGAGAIAHLVGGLHRGLEAMFVMMNAARFAVGLQGVGLAERAYQRAVRYARDRVQGKAPGADTGTAGPIIHHPDVRRMLLWMRSHIEGCRALASVSAAAFDLAMRHADESVRTERRAFHEFTVPVVKGFATEMSIDVASLGLQIHGGMGYIEETGAAQHLRDARILTIYEGTTAIQANDLVGRKTVRDGGAVARRISAGIAETVLILNTRSDAACAVMARRLDAARVAFDGVVKFIVARAATHPEAVYAGSVPYLMLCGKLLCGWQMARALIRVDELLSDGASNVDFLQAKIVTAQFFAEHVLVTAPAMRDAIVDGSGSTLAMRADWL